VRPPTGAVKRALRTSLALPFLDPAVCRVTNDERRQAQSGKTMNGSAAKRNRPSS
jgi:hypothetical protein